MADTAASNVRLYAALRLRLGAKKHSKSPAGAPTMEENQNGPRFAEPLAENTSVNTVESPQATTNPHPTSGRHSAMPAPADASF